MEKHPKPNVCRNMVGISAASVAGFLFMASPAHEALAADNPFVQQFGQDNPLAAPVLVDQYSKPAMVDIDNDGDMDLFVGAGYDDGITYYENTGTADSPAFTQRTGTANPLYGLEVYGGEGAPAFVDIDGDGDMDLFVGNDRGQIQYFENTGTVNAPAFTEGTGSNNPFTYECGTSYYGYDVGDWSTPAFADLDDDGDMDAAVGRRDGYIFYYENTGSASAPAFTEHHPTGSTMNPFYMMYTGMHSTPAFVDMDGDGDMDVTAGEGSGRLYYLENTGTASAPSFTVHEPYSDTANPFMGSDIGNYSAPFFADIDDDGDMDAVIGEGKGDLHFFENLGAASAPTFYERLRDEGPFGGFIVGYTSRPVFVDIDGDGDMDMFTGEYEHDPNDNLEEVEDVNGSILHFFKNVGTATAPAFAQAPEEENPLAVATPAPYGSFVAFADIDGDGDQDAFVGGEDSPSINFYENTGTASAPAFELKGDADNPLFFIDQEYNRALCFVDIDGDGDLDAFIGGQGGAYYDFARIRFYQNMGDAENPQFAQATPDDNPLFFVFGNYTGDNVHGLAFGDVDDDGDMDVVASAEGKLLFYENAGTATDPAFAPVPAVDDVFAKITENPEYWDLAPAFVDIDGDGDIDMVAGEYLGRFLYFENQSATDDDGAPAVAPEDDDTCFIKTVTPSAEGGNLLTRVMKQAWLAVTAVLR